MAEIPAFSISPHTQSKRPSISGWRKISVWKVKRTPSMPCGFFQPAICSRAPDASGSKRPMVQKRSGMSLGRFDCEVVAIALPRRRHDDDAVDAGLVHLGQKLVLAERRAVRLAANRPGSFR